MSQHHRRSKWTTDSPKFRKIIQPQLPLPCVQPGCGRLVMPDDNWHVGHRPGSDASTGRRASLADVGPAHARCNLRDGGRAGAAVTNRARTRQRQAEGDIRRWV